MSTSPQWQFVGNVPENYERHLVPSIFAPWAHDLIEAAALQLGERVLDIACGTGIVARTAARTLGDRGVVGLDLSAPMLAVARSAAEAEGVSAEWLEGSAVDLPLADATFDVAFCQQGLQFFLFDRPAALREMYRILVPSGRVVLSVWRGIEQSPGFAVLADALTRHISPEAGTLMTSGPFGFGDPEALRTVIAGASFGNITIRPAQKTLRFPSPEDFAIRYVAGSALASLVAGADDDARTELLAEVNARLQSYVDDQGLAFPIESNVVVARK